MPKDAEHSDLERCANHFLATTQFEVKDKLGQGSFGKVYLVFDRKLKRDFAAKVVVKPTYGEKQFWVKLHHRNILRLSQTINLVDKSVVYLMEYKGQDLYSILYDGIAKKRICGFDQKKKYMLHVLLGLEYLHAENYCHMDLKEENIIICAQSDTALICDFSTLDIEERTNANRFGLNPICLPPEVVSESRRREHSLIQAEMWTYGILVLHVFTKQYLLRNLKPHDSFDDVVYPKIMYIIRNPTVAKSLLEHAERRLFLPEEKVFQFLDFVDQFLVENPSQRATALKGQRHPFISKDAISTQEPNDCTFSNIDDIARKLQSMSIGRPAIAENAPPLETQTFRKMTRTIRSRKFTHVVVNQEVVKQPTKRLNSPVELRMSTKRQNLQVVNPNPFFLPCPSMDGDYSIDQQTCKPRFSPFNFLSKKTQINTMAATYINNVGEMAPLANWYIQPNFADFSRMQETNHVQQFTGNGPPQLSVVRPKKTRKRTKTVLRLQKAWQNLKKRLNIDCRTSPQRSDMFFLLHNTTARRDETKTDS